MGLLLRGAFVWGLSWIDYLNVLHGHSHVAMLGWVYLALFMLLGSRFIPADKWMQPVYSRLFWFTQFTVFGMMVAFPLQGYGAVSITFSALHIFASYVFVYLLWRDHSNVGTEVALLLKTALVFMVISTLGVWSLSPITALGGRSSTIYQLAIQFYLHFQFHGWFTFAVLALLLDAMTRNSFIKGTSFKRFYAMLLSSVALTYGLVLAWGYGGPIPLVINGLGLLLQLMALVLFLRLIRQGSRATFQSLSPSIRAFYRFGVISWIVKVAVQSVVLIPAAAVVSFVLRPLMIGFIHLTLLGFISGLLFAMLFSTGRKLPASKWMYAGVITFISGFALTELLLFAQGLFYWFQWGQLPAYYELIFATSILLPVAIVLMIINVIRYYNFKTANQVMITQ